MCGEYGIPYFLPLNKPRLLHMISSQQHLFQLPKDETYLNAAYMTPLAIEVEEAGVNGVRLKSQPGQITGQHFFEPADLIRKNFSTIINNNDPERIAIIPSVSYGLANVIANIDESYGHEIIVVKDQFPSAVFPIQNQRYSFEVKTINLPSLYKDRAARLSRDIIEAIRPHTAAVCIGTLLWTDGSLYDLKAISEACKEHNTLLIIDGTQSIGALPFDIEAIEADAVLCAGYKWLMGPYGIGVGYFGPVFDQGIPIEDNWINRQNSSDFSALTDYEERYRPKAQKYNVGEYSNFVTVPMLDKGLERVIEWTPERVQEYCSYLMEPLIKGLLDNGKYWIENDEKWRANHMIGIHVRDEAVLEDIKRQCQSAKIHVSYRGQCIRVSPHLYNTRSDIYRLTDILFSM